MKAIIQPAPLRGKINAITSKSDAHRLLVCASLADRPTGIGMAGTSDDINVTAACLRALGADITPDAVETRAVSEPGAAFTPGERGVLVKPISDVPPSPALDCMESGSTLRFLLPVAAALGANAAFLGRGRLPERPIGALTAQLAEHGVRFSSDRLPLSISGRMAGGGFSLPGDVSSQFITGLLLALPLCGGGEVALTSPLESASYAEITRRAMARFGVDVSALGGSFAVAPGHVYSSPGYIEAEGDWSGAAFFLAAGALSGEVTVTGLDMASPQGDRAIVELLRRFGAEVEINDAALTEPRVGEPRIEQPLSRSALDAALTAPRVGEPRMEKPLSHSALDAAVNAPCVGEPRMEQPFSRSALDAALTAPRLGEPRVEQPLSQSAFNASVTARRVGEPRMEQPLSQSALDAAVTAPRVGEPRGEQPLSRSAFGTAVTARRGGLLRACEIDVSDVPDLLPVLAVFACAAQGETIFTGGKRLRLKESDRIAATVSLIRALGGIARELPDGLAVTGSTLTGGEVDSFRDHRIAMSAAVAATICAGSVTISDPLCAAKSYPTFYDEYNKLGGDARVV